MVAIPALNERKYTRCLEINKVNRLDGGKSACVDILIKLMS